jgi:hypothetical protein
MELKKQSKYCYFNALFIFLQEESSESRAYKRQAHPPSQHEQDVCETHKTWMTGQNMCWPSLC